ncbi:MULTISPECIES: hypothetical protein [Ralstonia]|jgi:hypothetical protein|uniref:Uncharacterized protein n=1 Tax=Ralstonia pickettii OR214 TaxID=1264675 RepID=R0DVI0_RALPI|nr:MULTISPECIES: hypothetical protein [Ralstonia]ENZ77478.1 hypothetical protein OR214_02479 [Ralstonia pickettii OR214]MBL4778923.1 hypothetical protein [Ralstonia sp.]MCM3579592.1 hypothetical protein [Ralstonia pickettii]MDR9386252.1 hypothetical protein [Ralstonia sp. 11b]OYU21923.1 MAG: hypothetical protein CFE42_16695 [Ralstonia sp. PBBBR1]
MALTAAQIVAYALQIAKCPGFTSQGGQSLNLVLQDLCLHRDLKVNRKTQSIVVQANSNGPFNLEADYNRTYDLFFSQNNLPYFLHPISMEEYDQEFKDPSIANYPYEFATDLSPVAFGGVGLLYIYPQSSGQITLTHRYMVQQADILTPETSATVPWFSDTDYLIHATAYRMMRITDDERHDRFVKEAEEMLRTHLIMEGDEQAVVKQVRLDPRRFHTNRALKATKVTG